MEFLTQADGMVLVIVTAYACIGGSALFGYFSSITPDQ